MELASHWTPTARGIGQRAEAEHRAACSVTEGVYETLKFKWLGANSTRQESGVELWKCVHREVDITTGSEVSPTNLVQA